MGHIRLNYDDSKVFMDLMFLSDPWYRVRERFGSRAGDSFYLDEKYVIDNIDTDMAYMARIFYYYDELPEEHRVFLRLKWHF